MRPLSLVRQLGQPDACYRNTRSVPRRSIHPGRLLRVLHRPRSGRARGSRPGAGPSPVAGRRRDHDGRRHMVDALRRHARVHRAGTARLRPRRDRPLPPGGDLRDQRQLLRHQPPDRLAASRRTQRHLHGIRHRRDALHRHGGHAGARRPQLRAPLRRALPGHRHRRVDRGPLAGVPDHRSRPTTRRRRRHGPGHLGDALHRDARGYLHGSRPAQRGLGVRGARPDHAGAGGRGHDVRPARLRAGRLLVRAAVRGRSAAPGAGRSRPRQSGDDHGRADRVPGPRGEPADHRGRHQRLRLPALARGRPRISRKRARPR